MADAAPSPVDPELQQSDADTQQSGADTQQSGADAQQSDAVPELTVAAPKQTDAEPELNEAWQLLVGLVLDQRFRWAEVAAELKITQAGLRALLAIDPDHPRPMRELAATLNCDPSYVTAMIDDLERAGLAVRRPDSADRRVKAVALTAGGVGALRTARDGLFAPPEQLTRLSGPQQRELARLLRRGLGEI